MPDKLSDRQVLLAILMTLIIVFGLVFGLRHSVEDNTPQFLWKDPPSGQAKTLQI